MAESHPTKNCEHCGKEFVVRTNNRAKAKYCSKPCQEAGGKYKGRGWADGVCKNCGKQFRYLASCSPGKYCCRACRTEDWKKPSVERGFDDLTGRAFGRWTVLSHAGYINGHHKWNVRCSCAAKTEGCITGGSMRDGGSTCCGCIAREGEPRPDTKKCTACGKELPFTEEFFVRTEVPGFRWGLRPRCKPCNRVIMGKRHLRFRRKLKREVLTHYSGGGEPRCACCGVSGSLHFLTLDHINDDGKEDRKIHGLGAVFYAKMKRLGYPPHLQVLCWNCNLGKRDNGGTCPHKSM